MTAGNTKALTSSELDFVLSKYEFELVGDYVIVKANQRKTLHDKHQDFSLLLPLERKRVKISTRAIDLWERKYIGEYSLIEVQNAMNALQVMFQSPNEANVDDWLKRAKSKLNSEFKKGE